jgi:hypothetical protein
LGFEAAPVFLRNSFFSEEKKQKTFVFPPLPRLQAMASIFARAQE